LKLSPKVEDKGLMLRAKLICPPIRQRKIPFRIYVAIRVPPKPFSGAEAFLRSRSLGVGSGGGASYGHEE